MGGEGVGKVPNIPKGFWLEKRWDRGEEGKDRLGVSLETDRLKVACFHMGMTPFQAMYQCKKLS